MNPCPRCGKPTDPDWYCSEGYCPACCQETDEGADVADPPDNTV